MSTAVSLLGPHNCGVEIIEKSHQPDAPRRQRVVVEQGTVRRLDCPDGYQPVQRGAEQLGVSVNRRCILKSIHLANGLQSLGPQWLEDEVKSWFKILRAG